MATWQEVNQEILDRIDLEAEYKSMGLDIRGGPSSDGWASCKVFKSDERSPSAGVNLTGEHPHRGRYKCFTGECENLSFFEFCVRAGRFPDWKEARNHFRQQLGIKAPTGKKKPPQEKLVFRDYNENLVRSWCTHKPPIVPWAVRIAGGQITGYPATTQKFTCVAIPVFGPHGADDDPVGYQIYNKSGRTLPVFQGKGQPARQVKIKTVEGSEAGWMNRYALGNLATAEIVWKVEGPADMLALQSIIPAELLTKHLVVTNSSGTGGLLSDEHLDLLAGKVVYVLHDCDHDGQAGGSKWAEALSYICPEVRHVRLPYEIEPNHGKDLRDWLIEGHSYQDLLELATAAEVVKRPTKLNDAGELVEKERDPLAMERLICQQLRLDVLGELPDRKIKVFSEEYGKEVRIDNLNRLTRVDLIQMCGPSAKQHVFEGGADGGSPTQYHINTVREAIAMLAGQESAGEGVELGQGVWRGKGESADNLVLVGPGEAVVVNGTVERICRPRVAGLKIQMDAPKDSQWYNLDKLQEYFRLATDPAWRSEQIDAACDIWDQWYWRHTEKVCPELLTGLVMATWVQSVWHWRPLVSITGPSDCGKSSLFEVLETMFGPLAMLSSKSSEAGIRQSVANHSKIILCDEFESDKHRKQILEFFRTSSKGSRTYRGTISQNSRGYGLRHICWVTAIEIGLARAPDRNRFIALELATPPADRRGRLKLPSVPQIVDLGQRLLAIAVKHAIAAGVLAERLKGYSFEGVHGRVVESFSVPVAMLAVTCGLDEPGAVGLMGGIFERLGQDPQQGTKDEVALLGDIFSSTVNLGHGEEASVAQILAHPSSYSGGLDAMERAGVKLLYTRSDLSTRSGIFLAHQVILRYLLKGTQWAEQSIDQLLIRLPGARKRQVECGGHRPWGVMLGWDYVESRFLDADEETQPDF